MEIRKSNRNITLDLLKLIASFFVVFIHVPFGGYAGELISIIARFAVPVFFISSGFFCYGNEPKKVLSKLRSIIGIFIFTSLLYNLTNIVRTVLTDDNGTIGEYLMQFADMGKWLDFFIFNVPFSATRLWFLPALIYVYLLQYLVRRLKLSDSAVMVLSLSLLGINLLLAEILPAFSLETPIHFTRNFLLTGYPFFGIGLMLRKHNDRIVATKALYLWGCALAGVVLTLVSARCLSGVCELYTGSALLAVSLVALSVKYAGLAYPKYVVSLTACSMGIYIFHSPVTIALTTIMKFAGLSTDSVYAENLLPVAVVICTTVFVLIANVIERKIKSRSKK